jgi:peptidoglycan hydrolase-like protein with peptidoglycan-binding domain
MPDTTHPSGIWIWRLADIRPDYREALTTSGCRRIYLKVFDDLHAESMFWKRQCTPALIASVKEAGLEVHGWGYHFDQHARIDVAAETEAVQRAMACGLDGYILDVESEVEDDDTHPQLSRLLDSLRGVMGGKSLGYTSFGHPGVHRGVPWTLLDEKTDLAFPQIYFEKFGFRSTDEEEVQACLKAHETLGLRNPILPIWGSEPDTARPASASALQSYLNRFPGSSIWRAPHIGQRGEAWNLRYGGGPVVFTFDSEPADVALGPFPGMLQAADVLKVQQVLAAQGFDPGPLDGRYGPLTRRAVRAFQLRNNLSPDGVVGPVTWAALGGMASTTVPFASQTRERLASVAEAEAAKALKWTGRESEAEKYLQPLREPMRRLGHIGTAPVFFDWCAAFVTYCCREAGYKIPDQPEGFWATMALVESWKFWAQKSQTWYPAHTTTSERGDLVLFEWHDGDVSADHIGVVRGYTVGSTTLLTSEGNRNNRSGNFSDRRLSNVAGLVRLR